MQNEANEVTEQEVSEMVRELRVALGLTQEQFAARIGVTFSTVNRWENGRGAPSPLAMKQIEELRSQADLSDLRIPEEGE